MKLNSKDLKEYKDSLELKQRLSPRCVRDTLEITKRYLNYSKWFVSYQSVSAYLKSYLDNSGWTYNNQLKALRKLAQFLEWPELLKGYKMAPTNPHQTAIILPNLEQVKAGFNAQTNDRDRAIYLFLATTGLRKGEVLKLTKEQINQDTRTVIPNHYTRTKRSGVTFYNEETAGWLKKYLTSKEDDNPRLFSISDRQLRKIWDRASEAAVMRITAQALRKWHSSRLGELMVPDRYVDIFQGRAPRSVLAKHYTGNGLERLKRIYDKAGLRVLR